MFQHTAARRRLVLDEDGEPKGILVSTHSRPKAAGFGLDVLWVGIQRFNTQPPEGGWSSRANTCTEFSPFQHTAARRRLGGKGRQTGRCRCQVSTHSRPKAAGPARPI